MTLIRSLYQKGRVRIIPVDSGMGFEDWENRYRGQAKLQLRDFLDEDEENESGILRIERSPPQQTSVHQNTPQSAIMPVTCPKGHETTDRRRNKKILDPGGLLQKEGAKTKEGYPSHLALPHEKRGEVFLRQVAELQKEEEQMTSCLKPYKNGLLYKTRMWAKNEVDITLENYVAFKKEQDARRKSRFEFDFQSSEDLQYFFDSEEEIDDIPLTEEDFTPEQSHYKDHFSYFGAHFENGHDLREKKCSKATFGGWATEAMLSPVEEPSDEYVDTMDELQCLVESVSEYLAEKEEEISKYGSLPKSSKSRQASQGSNRMESFGEDHNNSSQQLKENPRLDSHTSSDESTSGVKNAMSSLFSSIAKGVGGGTKKSVPPPAAPPAPPSQSGLTKLLFFIPKSSSSAPVAVVSPVESSPEKSFSSLPSQSSLKAKTQGDNQEAEIRLKRQIQPSTKVRMYESQSHAIPQNSTLGKLNPLKLFSSGDNVISTLGCPQWDHSHTCEAAQAGGGGGKSEEKHLGQTPDKRTNNRPNPTDSKQENGPSSGPARLTSQGQSANVGFFSPLKKSLSLLMSPGTPVHRQVPVAVYPVFKSTEEPRLEQPADSGTFKQPFNSSDNISAQLSPKVHGGPPGFQKFASSENVHASVPTENRGDSLYDSTASTAATFTRSSAVPQESSERSWLSNLFSPTSASPTVKQTYPSNKNPQNSRQSGLHPQNVPNETRAAGESQRFLTSLFKDHSVDDTSQPKQGGLLSGILRVGSTSDISAVTISSTQRSSIPPQNPTEPCSLQRPDVERQKNISQETSHDSEMPPQQKGLLSSLLKFASSENIPSGQTNQQREGRNLDKNTKGPNSGSQLVNRQSSWQDVNQEISKPGFTPEQRAPIQQPTSQHSGILFGLFKFASADSLNAQQQSAFQQSQMQSSDSNNEGSETRNNTIPCENQPHVGSTQKPSGLFPGLFKSSTENVAQQQQTRSSQKMQQTKDPSSQRAEIQAETPRVLSGLFNKLNKSSEFTDTCPSRPLSERSLQQRACHSAVPAKTQLHTSVTQQASLDTKEGGVPTTAQEGYLTGLLNKAVTVEPSSPKQVQTSGNSAQQIPSTKLVEITSVLSKSVSTEFRQSQSPLVSGSFNQRRSRDASLGGPATMDSETLDLRTSATFARSFQTQSKYSSESTGNLSHLSYSTSLPLAHPVSYSTGNIYSLLQHQTSPIMSVLPPAYGSSSSLFDLGNHYKGQLSPYGVSPSYDENQWIHESVFWQQFQNESLNFQVHSADQLQRQSNEGPMLPGSTLHHSFSNIYQPYNSSTQLQGADYQEQIGTYPSHVQRNSDPLFKKRLWNSYEDLGNFAYTSSDYGVLNLTTNQSNCNIGKWHSFSNDSSYSLNGVSYHEGYYEEMPPNLSYSANWHGMDDAGQQNSQNKFQNQMNSNELIHTGYLPSDKSETESLYLEDTEWYQQWLSLLEQGMWWPAEDGDCGYFVYTDHEYIYALLTDAAGEYVYICTPEVESLGDTQRDRLPSAWPQNEMVCVCGFKIPLYNEDELLWLPGQHNGESQLLNGPLDLSTAYKKGNQIMNLNLKQFSQMFENSFLSQCQGDIDFSSYTLNKVKMDPGQSSCVTEDQCKDIIDLSCHSKGRIGNNWTNSEIKTLLSQKVALSLNSSPTTYTNHQLLHNCYQPSQKRRPSTSVTVKHVDDVLEKEWRECVSPGKDIPNRQAKKISSLIYSFATKESQGEVNKSRPSSDDHNSDDHKSKNILSSGLHSLKSKIIKDEPAVIVTEPQSVKHLAQKAAMTQVRVLPTIPTASQCSVQPHTTSQKMTLLRQSTVEQQASQPHAPLEQKESFIKTRQVKANMTTSVTGEKTSEQPPMGLMTSLKSADRFQIGSKTSLHQQTKTEKTSSFQDSAPLNKEATAVSNIFGSFSSLFSSEPSTPQAQVKPSFTEGSLASVNTPKCIQRQQALNQSGLSEPTKSQPPNKGLSQVFQSLRPSTGLPTSKSVPLAPIEQHKNEGSKPSTGLFGFSFGEMLSGPTTAAQSGITPHSASNVAPQEESVGKSILSIISEPNQNQSSHCTESMPQVSQTQTDSQPSQAESISKSILSLFGGSGFTSPPSQTKPLAEVTQQGTVPLKEPANTGFLSMFSGHSTQQSQGQTESLLGGLLPGSSSSAESPVRGLFSIFGDPTHPQTQPPTSLSQHETAQSLSQQQTSYPQSKPQTQPQSSNSRLGGILGGMSSNESHRKSLFSIFSSPGSTQTSGAARKTDLSTPKGTSVPENKIVFSNVSSSQQSPSLPLGTIPMGKEPPNDSFQQGSSEISSGSSSHDLVPEVSRKKSAMVYKPSPDSAINSASQPRNAECISDHNEISSQASPLNVLSSKQLHASSQTEATTKSILTQSFSGPSVLGPLPEVPPPEPSGLTDTSVKSLFSVFGGSAHQPSPQSGISILGTVFGGSSTQPTAPQTGGSLLGGLFTGSASPPCAPKGGGGAPLTAGPQSGTSVLGALFGGSTTQPAGSQAASSILGGLFRGSVVSTAGPKLSNADQTKPQNATSMLGGLLGGSFQTSKEQASANLQGGIFSGTSATREVPDKSQTLTSVPPSTPLPAPPSSCDENKTLLTDTTLVVASQKSRDRFQPVSRLGSSEQTAENVAQTDPQEEAPQQSDGIVPSSEENLHKVDVCVTEEGLWSQKTDIASDLSDDAQSKESDIEAQARPTETEVVSSQLSQGSSNYKVEQEELSKLSVSPEIQEHYFPEPEKPVVDSSTDAVKGLLSSPFKPVVASTAGSQQQKTSVFGGTEAQAADYQANTSLLGGIFGGSNTDTAAPQTGVSLMGGLFKGSGSQTQTSHTGGSILGGIFRGGPSAAASGQHSGGSVLTGMFRGPAALAQPGGSLLSGIFGGDCAHTDAAQPGTSALKGLGETLFGGTVKTSKPSEPIHVESKPTDKPSAQPQIKNESLIPILSPSSTEIETNKSVDSQKTTDQKQPSIQTARRENSSVSPSTTCDFIKNKTEREKSALEGERIDVKPLVFKESDTNGSQESQSTEGPSAQAEPGHIKSVFDFISTSTNAGKSLGSLFSPSISVSTAQSEGGSGLFSGLKNLSGGLFQEEKPVTRKQEPPTTLLFGTKISFPWQTEQKAQASPIVSQTTNHKDHAEPKVPTTDAPKIESVGSANITTPQICISNPDIDPSAILTPEEKETVIERPPSAGPSSGVQLDNQPNMELLNAKRPVEA